MPAISSASSSIPITRPKASPNISLKSNFMRVKYPGQERSQLQLSREFDGFSARLPQAAAG